MQQLTEIRWHARAGQGAVTAAKLVAETALELDQYMQAMPEYGPERMGAPIKAFTRISPEPIEIHCNIDHPNVVIVLDETLLAIVDVTEGLQDGGIIIVNTCKTPDALRTELKLEGRDVRVASVDASGISLETLKRDIPNTPMVGALAKATGLFSLDDVIAHLTKTFGKKFSQDVIDANIASVKRAYEEVSVG
ncbi:2-oxoacid:acceptor oxidoreductase family protein [Coriobacteriia bacterium Es71-Z0120]|uniref:2-oxoacid:acceptor oxidoreductase family protein n=1 Tax=Parvivirga hydrogeniphila TaxID=2939460 RepID=UPI002260F015|nr:2-oxoacid:acceptor oxidoreductase family protein [Parvivirga hydrogeniphila]MCL4078327.1 2-oxoacid:acceptor oxidoreductase family protein [Parvivirga hydrogeniphila]